jgi:hypothetical protein
MRQYGFAVALLVILAPLCQGGKCDIISGNHRQFRRACECGACCDRNTWLRDDEGWIAECGIMCRQKGCPDFAEDAMMFAIFIAGLGLLTWIPATGCYIMPLTRGENPGSAYPLLFGMLLLPLSIVINGLAYWWTFLVMPILVILFYVVVKRRSGCWPPKLANATLLATAKDSDGIPIQAGDAVTYGRQKKLVRVWLVELYENGEWRVRDSRNPKAMSFYLLNEASNFHKGHSWMPVVE